MIRSGFFSIMRNKTQKKKDVQLKQNNRNYEITGIIMLLFGVFSFVSLANYNTGILGSWANNGLHFLFGMGAFCLFWLSYSWVVIMF